MGILGKKWFRALVNFGIGFIISVIVLFGLGTEPFLESVDYLISNFVYHGALFGSLTFLGTFMYFAAYDLLGNKDSTFIGFIRGVLLILGTLIILAVGLLGYLIATEYAAQAALLNASPWLYAIGTLWLLGALTSFVLFYFAVDKKWNKKFLPFIPITCNLISYFVSVIFLYIGNAVGAFFYYIPLILAVLEIVFTIVLLRKNGLPFPTKKYSVTYEKSRGSANKNTGGGSTGSKESGNGKNKLPFADKRPIISKIKSKMYAIESLDSSYLRWDSRLTYTVDCYYTSISIRFSGRVKYCIGAGNKPSPEDVASREFYEEKLHDQIKYEISSIMDEVRNEYEGYDNSIRRLGDLDKAVENVKVYISQS